MTQGTEAVSTQRESTRWSFTDTENRLREHINDPRLRASLTAIRQTVDFIWDPHTTRMIQDYIDRDMDYCKQLVALVDQLLAANAGRHFSGQEIYVLLTCTA